MGNVIRKASYVSLYLKSLLVVGVLFATPVLAQEAAAPSRLQELEQQRQEALRQQRRAEQREHTTIPVELPELEPSAVSPEAKEECLPINRLSVDGVTQFDSDTVNQWLAPYQTECITRHAINQLLKRITRDYLEQGFVTSRAYLPSQDLSDGIFQITVVEGRVEAVRIEGGPARMASAAFPGLEGRVLNLRDIEQGLDQINRLAGVSATVEFVPGKKVGATVVMVSVREEEQVGAEFGLNNTGQESTGRRQGLISLSMSNLLGVNEFFNFNYQRNTQGNSQEKLSESLGFYSAMPFGYWLFSVSANRFEYLTIIDGATQTFSSSGDSRSQRLSAQRNLYRDQVSKLSGELLVKQQENNNFIEDTRLDTSSFSYSAMELSLNYERYFEGGATALLAGRYTRGLENDLPEQSTHLFDEDFNKLSLDLSYFSPVPWLGNRARWTSRLSVQHSSDALYSAEALTLGSRYTVRGFKEDSIDGTEGAYWRNEVSQTYFPSPHYPEYWLSPYVALDAGVVSGEDSLAGASVGLRAGGRYLNLELFYSEAISAPGSISKDDNKDIGFSLAMTANW
ncbi:ShlB/FhaC/HecB family hemolysin secretion/activation protein [Marinimicrobium locisalis]|uniref:ShlB/FhaC/HecB family hemolysin secretion/activation protein n=1 Tax=Marinimicrobium locisalis TaxID=546022 RepID=UPI0032219478